MTEALKLLRSVAAAILVFVFTISSPAIGQDEISSPNPIRTNGQGILGVNVVTRGIHHDEVDLVSGPQGEKSSIFLMRSLGNGISYGTSIGSLGNYHFFDHQFRVTASDLYFVDDLSNRWIQVVLFGKTYILRSIGGSTTLTNTYLDRDGSIFRDAGLSPSGYKLFEFISHDGVRVIFEKSPLYISDSLGSIFARYVEFPDGEFISFKYDSVTPPIAYWRTALPDRISRLTEVVNERGYGIRFTYVNPQTVGARDIQKVTIASAMPFHRVCTSGANCSEEIGAPVAYTYQQQINGFGRNILHLSTVQRPDGTVSTYTHGYPYDGYVTTSSGSGGAPDYAYETSLVDVATATGDATIGPAVFKVTDSLGRITRFDGRSGSISGAIVTEQNGAVSTYESFYDPTYPVPHNDPVIQRSTDALGRSTAYIYEIADKIQSITYPEGNSVVLTRDARGNVIEQRSIAKPGSGTPDIVTASAYPACDATNFRYCNNPIYTVGGNGQRTDYQYHSSSGMPELIVYPPDRDGVRRAVRYTYSSFSPADASSAAGLGSSSVWLKIAEDECRSSAVSGSAGNFVFACNPADLINTTYIYEPSTPSAPSRHMLLGQRVSAAEGQALTCFSYDAFGNRTGETAPAAALAVCPAQ